MHTQGSTEFLVSAAQAGDREALEALFRRYHPRVHRLVAVRLGRSSRAFEELEDLAQESLLDAFMSLDRFELRSEARFCNWFARCVENNIRDHFRRAGAKKRAAGRRRPMPECGTTTLSDTVFADHGPTPSQAARGKEFDEQLEAAMLSLSERDREAILLRTVCGMSAREMADELDIDSAENAQKLFERARKKLADSLGL